jgi:hypothetical protein
VERRLDYRSRVTVVGRFEDDDYMPEDGLLVVRDSAGGFWDDEMSQVEAHPCGTIVRTGHGWLFASGGDGPCVVRIRAHTDRPDDGGGEWADLVEIPYRCLTGAIGLTSLSTGSGEVSVSVGEPGLYRVRVAHRPLPVSDELPEDEDSLVPTDLWELDFWPVDDPLDPPRWLRRMRPAVGPLRPGWTSLLSHEVSEIGDVVRWSRADRAMTVDDLTQWGLDHFRGAEWLDKPLYSMSPRPGYPTLAEIAAQVGVPEPTTRREVLPLMVALGVLTFDGGRYVGVERPARAQDVLDLPAQVVSFLEASQAVNQFTGYAADLVSVALWGGADQTAAELASRSLASETDVQAALGYAEGRGLLRVDRGADGQLFLAPLDRRGNHRAGEAS